MAATGASPRSLLRFLTCGSVDDGKSTLIGRLLHDSRTIMDDSLATLAADSRRHGTVEDDLDLALLLDGLEAERQQGITIDVAYRSFSTPARAFRVADTPGHEQYTRNMATGASHCDLAVLLVDARKGLLTQTRRHAYICSLLGIRHVVLAVNKFDLVGWDEGVQARIAADFRAFAADLGFATIQPIPISARSGDNVGERSCNTPWYDGPTLLAHLETIDVEDDAVGLAFRFPVQSVSRPDEAFRGLAGTVASGRIAVGDAIVVATSRIASRIARIVTADGDLEEARAGDAVTLVLADEIDAARGDCLATPDRAPTVTDQFAAHILWLDDAALLPGRQYMMRIGTQWVPASITSIRHRVDVNRFEHVAARTLELNEVGFCNLSTLGRIALDAYAENRATGGFILVDRFTNRTAGLGLASFSLRRADNIPHERFLVDKAARAAFNGQSPAVLWFTGLSGSGKSTIAKRLEQRLFQQGKRTYTLDGDNVRHGLNRDLGFTDADRVENIRRVGEVARLMADAGLIVICSLISPFAAERAMVRSLVEAGEFVEIFVDTPLDECIRRDPKGLYRRALDREILHFTGLDSPYEAPITPEIRLETVDRSPDDLVEDILRWLTERGLLG